MYTIYLDNQLLFDPRVEELNVLNKILDLEVNNPGFFNFTIYPSHPLYNRIKRLDSIIEVFQNGYQIFRGRILDDEIDFQNGKRVLCEGELAYFNDSIIRPFEFQGSQTEFLDWIIDEHNAQVEPKKQFVLGNVTVETSTNYVNYSSINAMTSWEAINTRLLDLLGGFIVLRREDNTNYIDYVEDSNHMSLQEIKLGENLLGLNKMIKGSDIATAIIPYGARLLDEDGHETDVRLDIKSVNGGSDMLINQEAVDKYGLIVTTHTWDDVTLPQNLRTRGLERLAELQNLNVSIDIKAVDLSMTSDEFDELRFFEYVKVDSPSHLLDDYMLVSRLQLDLDNPANNTLTLGLSYDTFTQKQLETEKAVREVITRVPKDGKSGKTAYEVAVENGFEGTEAEWLTSLVGNDAALISATPPSDLTMLWYDTATGMLKIYDSDVEEWIYADETKQNEILNYVEEVQTNLTSSFEQEADAIRTEVLTEYLTLTAHSAYQESVSTEFTQLAESFEFTFTEMMQVISTLDSETQVQFEEFVKYIRFIDGNIVLGEVGNEITLRLMNDRIQFLQNGAEVAYFAHNKMYVTDLEVLSTFTLGQFQFVPRANGSLDLR